MGLIHHGTYDTAYWMEISRGRRRHQYRELGPTVPCTNSYTTTTLVGLAGALIAVTITLLPCDGGLGDFPAQPHNHSLDMPVETPMMEYILKPFLVFKTTFGFEARHSQDEDNWIDDTMARLSGLKLIKKLLRFLIYLQLNICLGNQMKFQELI